jgi:integrase
MELRNIKTKGRARCIIEKNITQRNKAKKIVKYLKRFSRNNLDLNLKFHNLCHTHASKLAEKNVPTMIVKNRLGHGKEETTMKYYTYVTKGIRKNPLNTVNAM